MYTNRSFIFSVYYCFAASLSINISCCSIFFGCPL